MRPIVSELYTMSTNFLQQRLLCMCMKIKDHFIILDYLFRVRIMQYYIVNMGRVINLHTN